MPPSDLAGRLLVATVVAALFGPGVAGPATVAAVSAVPSEDVAPLSSGRQTFAALVADVDGDGTRELVRLAPWSTNPAQLAVEVASVDGGGTARIHDDALLRRAVTVDDLQNNRLPDDEGMLPVGAREAGRLLIWRHDGREAVLAVGGGVNALPRPCCLTLWRVGLDGRGATELSLVQDAALGAAQVRVADLDADGTDELVVAEAHNPAHPGRLGIAVLRWNGRTFDRLRTSVDGVPTPDRLLPLGDSDGRPGDEVGIVTPSRGDRLQLHRIALGGGGAIVIDSTTIPLDGAVVPMPGPDGGRLAVVGGDESILLRWPAGSRRVEIEATSGRGGAPLGVIGTGAEARLMVASGDQLDVLGPDLASRQGIGAAVPALRFGPSAPGPYVGPLPGGTADDAPALFFRGRFITEPSTLPLLTTDNVAVLPGVQPLGLLGPGRGWMALAAGGRIHEDRLGGPMAFGTGQRAETLVLARARDVLRPEEDDGQLEPDIEGAVPDGRPLLRPLLLTRGELVVGVTAPPGSRVLLTAASVELRDVAVGAQGTVTLSFADAPRDDGDRYSAELFVITPAGHGYRASWDVQVMRRAPALRVSAPFAPLSFDVPLTGRTERGVVVRIDGQPIAVEPDGSFVSPVAAGPLPTSVRVRATDPVGNVTEVTLSVVGVLDYRRLPWIPIVAVLTLATGVVLYLRSPRPSAAPRRSVEDGTLEEIE